MLADTDGYDFAEKYGFEKISEQTIEECKSTAVLYKHKKTGAEVMSVLNDDENKVFGIVLRTPPYVPLFIYFF
jgi:presequence protease